MAFCTKQKEVHDLVEGSIVDQTGSSCNLLLVELSRLGKIVEQFANDRDHGPSSTAAPELGER
jgi:hypothetical protein